MVTDRHHAENRAEAEGSEGHRGLIIKGFILNKQQGSSIFQGCCSLFLSVL